MIIIIKISGLILYPHIFTIINKMKIYFFLLSLLPVYQVNQISEKLETVIPYV